MTKSILLIGYNFSPEPTGIGKYSGEMIEWLSEKGYECTVITTYPYYPYWKVQSPYYNKRFSYTTEDQILQSGRKIKIHRCPIYVPENPSGLERMLLDLSFLISATFKTLQLIPKKNLTMSSQLCLLSSLVYLESFTKRSEKLNFYITFRICKLRLLKT